MERSSCFIMLRRSSRLLFMKPSSDIICCVYTAQPSTYGPLPKMLRNTRRVLGSNALANSELHVMARHSFVDGDLHHAVAVVFAQLGFHADALGMLGGMGVTQ